MSEASLTGHDCDKWSREPKYVRLEIPAEVLILIPVWGSVDCENKNKQTSNLDWGVPAYKRPAWRIQVRANEPHTDLKEEEAASEESIGWIIGGWFSWCFDGFSVSRFVVCQRLHPSTLYPNINPFLFFLTYSLIQFDVIFISHQGNLDWRLPVFFSWWVCAFVSFLLSKGPLIVYSVMAVDLLWWLYLLFIYSSLEDVKAPGR